MATKPPSSVRPRIILYSLSMNTYYNNQLINIYKIQTFICAYRVYKFNYLDTVEIKNFMILTWKKIDQI